MRISPRPARTSRGNSNGDAHREDLYPPGAAATQDGNTLLQTGGIALLPTDDLAGSGHGAGQSPLQRPLYTADWPGNVRQSGDLGRLTISHILVSVNLSFEEDANERTGD